MTSFTSSWQGAIELDRMVDPEKDTVIQWGRVMWRERDGKRELVQQAVIFSFEYYKGYCLVGMETLRNTVSR